MNGVEIWDQINESVKVVAWPAVVGGAVWIFRDKLGSLFSRLREADTPAGKMKFDPAAERAISEDGAKLVTGVAGQVATIAAGADLTLRHNTAVSGNGDGAQEGDRGEGSGHVSVASQPDFSDLKEDVEALIRSSVAAGYQLAVRNYDVDFEPGTTPIPIIEWDGAEPYIVDYERPLAALIGTLRGRRNALKVFRNEAKTTSERNAINHASVLLSEIESAASEGDSQRVDILFARYRKQMEVIGEARSKQSATAGDRQEE